MPRAPTSPHSAAGRGAALLRGARRPSREGDPAGAGAGRWVLCDRFSDSTRVYQGGAGGARHGRVRRARELRGRHDPARPDAHHRRAGARPGWRAPRCVAASPQARRQRKPARCSPIATSRATSPSTRSCRDGFLADRRRRAGALRRHRRPTSGRGGRGGRSGRRSTARLLGEAR